MLDFFLVGPVIGIFATVDVLLHLKLDLAKIHRENSTVFSEPATSVPNGTMAAVTIATLLSFCLALLFPIAWVSNTGEFLVMLMIPLYDAPFALWFIGLILLTIGIVIHGWSRYVRHDMASSWAMSNQHVLITRGPYSQVRHPSYTSYILCFLGIVFLVPSVVSLILLIGIPGYYNVILYEEKYLLQVFGEEYAEYMEHTGRILPFPRTGKPSE